MAKSKGWGLFDALTWFGEQQVEKYNVCWSKRGIKR